MGKNLTDLKSDIYYADEYVDLYLTRAVIKFGFEYCEGSCKVEFSGLQRRILKVAEFEVDEELYDVESVYGYSGPLTNSSDPEFLGRAVNAYKKYCVSKKIVCEFIRLHPLANWEIFSSHFDLYTLNRNVVIKELPHDGELISSYPKNTRSIIRRARKKLTVSTSPEYLDFFMLAYYDTMRRNGASKLYFYDSLYFNRLISSENVTLITMLDNEEPVCGGFFMAGEECGHYHLSANTNASYKIDGNYALLDAAFRHFMRLGINKVLLGGGRTNDPSDPLFKFKCKFSKVTTPFFIAGYDFMPEKRKQLNELYVKNGKSGKTASLFQSYRMGDYE